MWLLFLVTLYIYTPTRAIGLPHSEFLSTFHTILSICSTMGTKYMNFVYVVVVAWMIRQGDKCLCYNIDPKSYPWAQREHVREGNLIANVIVDVIGGDVSIIMLCKVNALLLLFWVNKWVSHYKRVHIQPFYLNPISDRAHRGPSQWPNQCTRRKEKQGQVAK